MAIEYQTIINKLGKEKATEFIKESRLNQPTGADRERGIRGRIRFNICGHGVVKIDEYEPTGNHCVKCDGMLVTKPKEFKPYFNIGLGCFVESRQDEKRAAKSKGLIENG